MARLGTRRLCGPWGPHWIGFSPDGTKVASSGGYGIPGGLTVWDAATGRVGREDAL